MMMLNHKRLHKSRPYTHSHATCLPRQWATSLSIFRSRKKQDLPWLYSCILYSYRSLNRRHDTRKVLLGRFPCQREVLRLKSTRLFTSSSFKAYFASPTETSSHSHIKLLSNGVFSEKRSAISPCL